MGGGGGDRAAGAVRRDGVTLGCGWQGGTAVAIRDARGDVDGDDRYGDPRVSGRRQDEDDAEPGRLPERGLGRGRGPRLEPGVRQAGCGPRRGLTALRAPWRRIGRTGPRPQVVSVIGRSWVQGVEMERETGFEPATFC